MKAPENKYCLLSLRFITYTKVIAASFCLLIACPVIPANAQQLLLESSYKYQVTRQVFERLTYVFANSRPQPRLEIIARHSGKSKIIAQYQPGNRPLIRLSEEVYDLCSGLGKDSLNALAVLLSHELAHHYEKHDWYYTFGIGQADVQPSKAEIERFESEADFYGCFYGELAGFSTGQIFPSLVDLLYQHFALSDQLPGYPAKEERKAIYSKKQTEAGQMLAVFKAGQFLYLTRQFEYAASCFSYLLNRFPSREILNNLSAVKLQQALEMYNAHQPPGFLYPVELDARSRLAAIHRATPGQFNARLFGQLLGEARKYTEKSREIDPDYIPAYVNLACIYSLGDNQAAAIGVVNELGTDRITGNAHTVRAIAYYKDKQPEKARKDFESASQQGGYMAEYNLALYNKLNGTIIENLTAWIHSWFAQEEKAASHNKPRLNQPRKMSGTIAGIALPVEGNVVKVTENPYLLVQWKADDIHLLLGIQTACCRYLVRNMHHNYAGKTDKGVGNGSSVTALIKQYGIPAYTFPASSGEFWIYPDHKLAFEIGSSKQVKNWLIYSQSL